MHSVVNKYLNRLLNKDLNWFAKEKSSGLSDGKKPGLKKQIPKEAFPIQDPLLESDQAQPLEA
mgnify:CR=1 FL=1